MLFLFWTVALKIGLVSSWSFAETARPLPPLCQHQFQSGPNQGDLVALLNLSISEGHLDLSDLKEILSGLESFPRPAVRLGPQRVAPHIVEMTIRNLIDRRTLSRAQAVQQIRHILNLHRNEDGERVLVTERTASAWRKSKFIPVKGGPVRTIKGTGLDEAQEIVEFEVEHDFEIMDAPVTQLDWYAIAKQIPDDLLKGMNPWDVLEVKVDGSPVAMAPEHPVGCVSIWSRAEFANRLSILHGLKPVYKFRGRQTGSFESGTLEYEEGISTVSDDVRQLEGYRFPLETEWLLIMSDLIAQIDALPEHAQISLMQNHGWFAPESGEKIKAVGQREPLLVDGNPIYDLLGNSQEVLHGFGFGERNPMHPSKIGAMLVGRGGNAVSVPVQGSPPPVIHTINIGPVVVGHQGWRAPRADLARSGFAYQSRLPPDGFRLVRTVFSGAK